MEGEAKSTGMSSFSGEAKSTGMSSLAGEAKSTRDELILRRS
jgi:hypothetical protein